MRIAHVLPSGLHSYSGLLTALVHLASALARRHHTVEVWLPGGWPPDADDLAETLTRAGVSCIGTPPSGGPHSTWRCLHHLARRDVDVVHLHGVFNLWNIMLANLLANRMPYVISPHGGYAPESLAHHAIRKRWFARLFERPMLRRASAVCALTSTERDELRRFAVQTAIEVVPNGVDNSSEVPEASEVRRGLRVGPTEFLAVYVGRLDVRSKRLDEAVRGVAGVPRWHLALVGGDFRDGAAAIATLSRQLAVQDRIHLLGPRRGERLRQTLRAADAFVLLSRSEGMPMALLEAAAEGVPVVVSEEVERRVSVAASGGGWIVEPGRLSELLGTLTLLPADRWHERRRAAHAFAATFEWSRVAEEYEPVYQQAIEASATQQRRARRQKNRRA